MAGVYLVLDKHMWNFGV